MNVRKKWYASILFYFLAMLPLLVILAWQLNLEFRLGGEEGVYLFYKQFRAQHAGLSSVMRFITDFGNPLFYVVYAGIYLYGWKTKNRALMRFAITYAVVQLCVSFLVVRFLKVCIGKPRPGVEGLWHALSFAGKYNSMPSGHSCEIAGAVLPLVLRWKSWALTLVLACVLCVVAYSRVYLGSHHVSDVACGALLGSFAGWTVYFYSNDTNGGDHEKI